MSASYFVLRARSARRKILLSKGKGTEEIALAEGKCDFFGGAAGFCLQQKQKPHKQAVFVVLTTILYNAQYNTADYLRQIFA